MLAKYAREKKLGVGVTKQKKIGVGVGLVKDAGWYNLQEYLSWHYGMGGTVNRL